MDHSRKRATTARAPAITLSKLYIAGDEPAPDEELAEPKLELALPAEAADVVLELSVLSLEEEPEPEPEPEDMEAVCEAIAEPELEPVIVACVAVPDEPLPVAVAAAATATFVLAEREHEALRNTYKRFQYLAQT